jgi:hypothetical protein
VTEEARVVWGYVLGVFMTIALPVAAGVAGFKVGTYSEQADSFGEGYKLGLTHGGEDTSKKIKAICDGKGVLVWRGTGQRYSCAKGTRL